MTEVVKSSNGLDNGTKEVARKPYKREIVWFNAIGFLILHLLAVYGFSMSRRVKLLSWIWAVSIGFISGFGIGMGGHRYFAHKTFKVKWPLRLALVAAHTLAGQNCLYIWVREHRQHHKYTDTNADPHNSTRGFFFSHIGWLMVRKHPDVIEKGKTTDMSDLEADPFVMFQKKYYKPLYVVFALLFPMVVPWYFWNEELWICFMGMFFSRSIVVLNVTWLVNSAAHLYGDRPFNNKLQPVENAWVAWLTMGEGWHNYHHTFPWDYRASEFGAKYSFNTTLIDFCARMGWAYDMKQAPQSMVKKWAQKYGDGSHPVYGVNGAEFMGVGEVKYVPDKCAVTDLEANKNIQRDVDGNTDDYFSEMNKSESIVEANNHKNGISHRVR